MDDEPLDEQEIEHEPMLEPQTAEPAAADIGGQMPRKKTKKTKSSKGPKKARVVKTSRPKKPSTTDRATRLTADTVFEFVSDGGVSETGRDRAISNAIKKIGSGTAADVAKAIAKSDYDGKMDKTYIAGRFLRDMVKTGAVKVEKAK